MSIARPRVPLTGGGLLYGTLGSGAAWRGIFNNRWEASGPIWATRKEIVYKGFHTLLRLLHLMGRNAHTNIDGSSILLQDSKCNEIISQAKWSDTLDFTFTKAGTFGIGMKYDCEFDDENTYIAKAILPNNTIKDIKEEINISKRFATSGSPFIAQFLFALSFADRKFTSKNDGETMSLSNLYNELKRIYTSENDKRLFDIEYPELNEQIEKDTYNSMPVGIIAVEKGKDVLESITKNLLIF